MTLRARLIQTLVIVAFFAAIRVLLQDRTIGQAIPEALIFGYFYWVASKIIDRVLGKKTTKETDQ